MRLEQDRVRERMRVFHNLMDQAREQQAFRQAQAIRKDLVDQGLPVPPAVTAGYAVGLAGYHLREEQELRRIRQERWLATMLEVEQSHIPFPDEPPVEFPPAATWRALSEMRKARYESSTFGADMPGRGIELRKRLLSIRVNYSGWTIPRRRSNDALDQLSKRLWPAHSTSMRRRSRWRDHGGGTDGDHRPVADPGDAYHALDHSA